MSMLKLTQTHFPPEIPPLPPEAQAQNTSGHPGSSQPCTFIPKRARCSQLPIASALAHYL